MQYNIKGAAVCHIFTSVTPMFILSQQHSYYKQTNIISTNFAFSLGQFWKEISLQSFGASLDGGINETQMKKKA